MKRSRQYFPALIIAGLALVTIAVYWPVTGFEFINYDDPDYVTENLQVQRGLTAQSLLWSLQHSVSGNWQPLTLWSHMLDCQLYGLKPAGHHLTNLLFHVANTLLLFGVFKRMTGATGRSAFVAALFALHPLHVESVAWVAERKDVLSTFFFMLTLWAYARYVSESKVQSPKSRVFYALSLALFALGLMSKPMLVTLPFVLLLLDYWPLGRVSGVRCQVSGKDTRSPNLTPGTTHRAPYLRLLREKLPFFLLAAVMAAVTVKVQKQAEAVQSLVTLPFSSRLANAVTSYANYIQNLIWPDSLSVFYPYPDSFPAWKVAVAMLLLVAVSVAAVIQHRRRPYLIVGWLWYVGMLVPVIGLVQVGTQSMADRYTYVPVVGLFVVMTWGVHELVLKRGRGAQVFLAAAAFTILAGSAVATRLQIRQWKNSETLFTHALAVTKSNYVGHLNLGNAFGAQGKLAEAVPHLRDAVRLRPDLAGAHNNLANALAGTGQTAEAKTHYLETIRLKPTHFGAHNNLGLLLAEDGKFDEAIAQYTTALQIKPDYAEVHNNWGEALLKQGKADEAIAQFTRALKDGADPITSHQNLGNALTLQRKPEEAIRHYREAVRLGPDLVKGLNRLAWVLATGSDPHFRNGAEAVRLAERAVELAKNADARTLDTLAAAYAAVERFAEAVKAAQRAQELAETIGQKELAAQIRGRLSDYEAGKPYRE